MKVVKFRKCNKYIELDSSKDIERDFDESMWVESRTNGFYSKGINGSFLFFVVIDSVPYLKYLDSIFLFDKNIIFEIKEISEQVWELKFNDYFFKYNSYYYFPYDDDSEADVNFGLWLIELLKDRELLKRVIKNNEGNVPIR